MTCSGELPEAGRAELTARLSGLQKTIDLKPQSKGSSVYVGRLEPLQEDVRYQLYLGDAWTDPAMLGPRELPVVTVELEVEPPTYARSDTDETSTKMPIGMRQISVIEGSRVVVHLRSNKPLKEATLSIEGEGNGDKPHLLRHLEAEDGQQVDSWVLDQDESPLAAVVEPVRYAVAVVDEDGQRLPRPIEGTIRIQADTPPRVAAAINTRYVLPNAIPAVHFRAMDDYGLRRLAIQYQVSRDGAEAPRTGEIEMYALADGAKPPRDVQPTEGFTLDLTPLQLSKGDTLEVTVTAVDYRGDRPGETAQADPVVFEVTDEQGVRASMLESDRHSAQQLKTMIQRQLGIGDSP